MEEIALILKSEILWYYSSVNKIFYLISVLVILLTLKFTFVNLTF